MRSRSLHPAPVLCLAAGLLVSAAGCQSINSPYVHASGSTLNTALGIAGGIYVVTAVINSMPESRGVMIASKPVGARVLIDGRDSGFATPCCLAIDQKKQRVDLVLDGYQTASRIVDEDDRTYLIYWNEAYLGPNSYHFPMFLNVYDGWVPVRFEQTYSPERIFVHMRPAVMP